MKKLSNASINELQELAALVQKMETLMQRDFTHVSDYLPQSLKTEIQSMSIRLEMVLTVREN